MSTKRKASTDLSNTNEKEFKETPVTEKRQLSVSWTGDHLTGTLTLIDQRNLPLSISTVEHDSVEAVAESIKIMLVRGAPAIGAAGGFGMAIAAQKSHAKTTQELVKDLIHAKSVLDAARPTAVNLSWATARMVELATKMADAGIEINIFRERLLHEAQELATDDIRINKRLGDFGAAVVPQNANLLHHCNTGFLATVDYGTALGVIYSAHAQNKNIHVWVDETRPRLQGARLTAWELTREKVPFHLIADNAAGLLMYSGKVDLVVFGADRVSANGDVANKIGTYKVAVCARENGIPVYACVPTPTIDLDTPDGTKIHIEERGSEEVTHVGDTVIAPFGCPVFNPAFDVTPHKYLTGIITEEGICYPPFHVSLRAAKLAAEARVREFHAQRLQTYLSK